ncbi:MAG: hypothetical protein J5509_10120 [Lachnospiraceae bacterium]|nr:hypothetical protein [Lachnospiraceae bacterium]
MIILRRPAGNVYEIKQVLPKVGSEPVYVELSDGEAFTAKYTPDEDMHVTALELLVVNISDEAADTDDESEGACLSVLVRPADDPSEELFSGDIPLDSLTGGEWSASAAEFNLTAGVKYDMEFTAHGVAPFFMKVDDYEPGMSVGFDINTGRKLTLEDVFYHSTAMILILTIVVILFVIFGKERLEGSFAKISGKIDICIPMMVLLFIAISLNIYKTAYLDGIYITADSDGYLREAVNLVAGNGFSYEGLAGYSSHFANWPIIYPAMIAGMMLITGTNAYLASKLVAMAVIFGIMAVLFFTYKNDAWIYSLALTNAGFLGLAYNTWSEIPFILFMIIFGVALGKLVSEDDPKTVTYIVLGISAAAAFLTRYFGIFLWHVAGLFWLMILIGHLRNGKTQLRKLLLMAGSMAGAGVLCVLYLIMNKLLNGYPTGVSRGIWWDDIVSLTNDLIDSLITEIFNIFSLDVPGFVEGLAYEHKALLIVFTVLLIVFIIHKLLLRKTGPERYMNTHCVFIVMSAVYYVMFIAVRYRSSMDTFYFRFFAPATIFLVIGIMGLILEGHKPGRFCRIFAMAIAVIAVLSVIDHTEKIMEAKGEKTYYEIAASAWDRDYSEIPKRSTVIWNPLDYRSSWYRPDVYSGELYMSDTWDSLRERYYGSEYICVRRSDARTVVDDGGYDKTITEHFEAALSESPEDNEFIVMTR